METKLFSESEKDIEEAAGIIAGGGLVAFPTETVYGLGADAFNEKAVAKIYEVKGRAADNPTNVLIADLCDMSRLADPDWLAGCENAQGSISALADAFWPGPLTIIVKARDTVPGIVTAGRPTVGIRMPDNDAARELIRRSGTLIAAPSANLSGRPSPTSAGHVMEDLRGKIEAVMDGGPCELGLESTVVDLTGEVPVIVRQGMIPKERIEAVIGKEVSDAGGSAPAEKLSHYRPNAGMTVFSGTPRAVRKALEKAKEQAEAAGKKTFVINFHGDSTKEASKKLFAMLRAADAEGADLILAAAPPEESAWEAVNDRLAKAAGGNIVNTKEDKMIIAMGSDHAGFELKNILAEHLRGRGYEIMDVGCYSTDPVDYPIYGKAVGEAVVSGKADKGVVVCGTGIGISMAANKVHGVRCGLCTSVEMAHKTKEHNDANVIAFGGRLTEPELAVAMLDEWLDTEFAGKHHTRRVEMLNEM